MSFKAKTVLNKDVRVFKQDIDSMDQGLEAIKKFIEDKYEMKGPFTIQYEDEEKDLVTIATSEDLEEAYDQAEANGSVLKLVIVPEDNSGPIEFTSELDKSQVNEQGVNTSSDEEEEEEEKQEKVEEESCNGKKLLQDLINNKEFRQEFINFIVNLITILKQDIPNITKDIFQQTLSKHDNVAKHPALKQLNDILPTLLNQFIGAIDVENIGTWINSIIEMLSIFNLNNNGNNDFHGFMNGNNMIPMLLMQLFGGFPFGHMPPPPPPPPSHYYGGHHYPHAHAHHGYGSFAHPPPPPPFHPWFGQFGNFGSFVPPPPPSSFGANPFGFNGSCPRRKHGCGFGGPRHGHGYGRRCRRNPHAHDNNFQEDKTHCEPHSHAFAHPPPPPPPFHGLGPLGLLFGFNSCHGQDQNQDESPCKGKEWKKYCKQWKQGNENNEYNVEILNDSVTLTDKAYVLPEQVIVKTWHVKNNGKKDWPQGMKLKYFGPTFNPIINGVEFNVPELKINEEADISVIIETPKLQDNNMKNKQKAKFRLCLPNNDGFIGPIFKIRVFIIDNNNNELSQEQDQVVIINDEISQAEKEEEKKEQENNVNDVIEKLKENKINHNDSSSSPSSFADIYVPKIEELNIDEDIDIIPKEEIQESSMVESIIIPSQVQEEENKPLVNKEEEKPYIYENQLNVILSMGFDNVEKIRGLLDANKGDINVVIGQLFA